MVSKAVSSRAPSNASSLVRRNLFHHHLSRRPSSTLTSTSATTLPDLPLDSSSEIVMRDPHGNYAVQIPLLPPLEEDQVPEDETTERESKFRQFFGNTSIMLMRN